MRFGLLNYSNQHFSHTHTYYVSIFQKMLGTIAKKEITICQKTKSKGQTSLCLRSFQECFVEDSLTSASV